jgi:phage terminase large subunit
VKENKTEAVYELPNGSEVWLGGLDDKARVEKILGNEFGTMYFNECSQIGYEEQETALTRLAQKVDGMKLMALYDANPPSIMYFVNTKQSSFCTCRVTTF